MAILKDKLTKAFEQKAHTQTSDTTQNRASWEEALDRHVSVPASRALEAAEVFRGFAGSWAADYELGLGGSSEQSGAVGVPALQRKINRLGQPGMAEINFRPYDWNTHRFGPKGPSLLGHPISFGIVGPTLKTNHCDWQWALTDNSGTANGDVLTIDTEAADDVSVRSQPPGAGTIQTAVQLIGGGGATTLKDYYGFDDTTVFNGGLYLVVSMTGSEGTLTNPAGSGGPGDGLVGDPTGPGVRSGVVPIYNTSKTEIFRITSWNNAAKTLTLDPAKHITDFFTLVNTPIIRAITLFKPEATRLVAVPGSGPVGGEQTFAFVPPERALGNEYTPPYELWTNATGGLYDPWVGPFTYGAAGVGLDTTYQYHPLLPLDKPTQLSGFWAPDSFTVAPALISIDAGRLSVAIENGYIPREGDSLNKLVRVYEAEYVGSIVPFDPGSGVGEVWVADPGTDFLLGFHEVTGEDYSGGLVSSVRIARIPEVDPATGVPFYTPQGALRPDSVIGANDGIRWKASWHDAVKSIWTDRHASIEKISSARLTNLINPDWVRGSQSLKQKWDAPVVVGAFVNATPDKAVFDTTTSNAGAAGSNADPGNMMDLGFRVVLFGAKDGGAGHLVPDFDSPVSERSTVLDPTTTDEQWWDIDYSAGLIHLSHALVSGSTLAPNGVVLSELVVGTGIQFAFADTGGNTDTITRSAGDWIADGVRVGHQGSIRKATNSTNNGDFLVTAVTATILTIQAHLGQGAHALVTDAADTSAEVLFGDNRRKEVVLFASCVPYSREAGQMGANVRVTSGRPATANSCGVDAEANADVYGGRTYWRIQGTNSVPQTITSAPGNIDIDLTSIILPTEIPSRGFIEIVAGLDPEGPSAFFDGDRNPVATFGFTFDNTIWGATGTTLRNCFGGIGVQSITVDDDNPYIAVLRRDVMLPSDGVGNTGTSYKHDVTYGSSFRATALRFKHARLVTQVDGSVLVEGLEELAQQHETLFKNVLSSWVLDGFLVTDPNNGRQVDVGSGVVLIDGVRSEMAPTSIDLPAVAGSYYLYIEPLNTDPACPALNAQVGLPLAQTNHVLVGLAVNDGANITEVVDLQKKMQDIDLRDDIIVGGPSGGQPNYSNHPHFTELADAVKYACELTTYRQSSGVSTDAFGDRYLKIKVVGPTAEQSGKMPIVFTASGIIIEGAGIHHEGDKGAIGGDIANMMSINWSTDVALFDLNGQDNLTFRDLVLEYLDKGQVAASDMVRAAFINGINAPTSYIRIENCHLLGFNELSSGPPPNIAQAFVHIRSSIHTHWHISNCSAVVSDSGVYFGGDNTGVAATVQELRGIIIENCKFSTYWRLAGNNGPTQIGGVTGSLGINQVAPEIEPEPHGAIVFATMDRTVGCVVRNCDFRYWSGFGIFDNGAEGNLYDGNMFEDLGDAGVYTGCDFTLYDVTGGRVAGKGTRIVNNVLFRTHDFPFSAGVAGRKTQVEIAAALGVPGAPTPTFKVCIRVGPASVGVVVANNHANISSGLASSASVLVGATDALVLGNHCDEGIKTESTANRLSVVSNRITGDTGLRGAFSFFSSNYLGGNLDAIVAVDAIFADNLVLGEFTGVSTNSIVVGCKFEKGTPVFTTTFASKCVVTGNRYGGTGALAVWEFSDDCVVTGNQLQSGDFEIVGNGVQMVGNRFVDFGVQAATPSPVVKTVLTNNSITGGILFNLAAGAFTDSLIASNLIGANGIIFDTGAVGQRHDHNIISGNRIAAADIDIQGGQANVISDNVLTGAAGFITLGDAAGPSQVSNTVIVNNVIEGQQEQEAIPVTGIAGGPFNYDASITIRGSASIHNVISGNFCFGGLVLGTGTDYTNVTGNVFHHTALNCSVLIQGLNCIFNDNIVDCNATEDVVINSAGAGAIISGNQLILGAIYSTGTEAVISGNWANDVAGQAYVLMSAGTAAVISGNFFEGDIDIDAASDETMFSANRIGGDMLFAGANGAVTGNVIGPLLGQLLITGSGNVVSGNFVNTTITISASGNTVTGNTCPGLVSFSATGLDSTLSGNTVGSISMSGRNTVVSNNRVGTSITLIGDSVNVSGNVVGTDIQTWLTGTYDANNYVISGNIVTGDIITAGVTNGNGRGVVTGNIAGRIVGNTVAAPQAIPAVGHLVLGNKIMNAGTDIYAVDPGNDSVGLSAANQIIDFNVGG